MEQTYLLRKILCECKRLKKCTFMCFVDMESAFLPLGATLFGHACKKQASHVNFTEPSNLCMIAVLLPFEMPLVLLNGSPSSLVRAKARACPLFFSPLSSPRFLEL
jgi:hypothetical protein